MGNTEETYNMQKVRGFGVYNPKWMSSSKPSPQDSTWKTKKMLKEAEVVDGSKETAFSDTAGIIQMNSHGLTTSNLKMFKPDKIQA